MGVKTLFSLVGKNLKMFFRSKMSSMAVMLIPLAVILLTGVAFNSSQYSNIQVGIYSESYSDFTWSIIDDFQKDNFRAQTYETEAGCISSVKKSESQICVVFPSDLSPDITEEEIVFHADYSRVNLVGDLTSKIQKNVLSKTSGVGEELAQDLIGSLEDIKSKLPEAKTKLENAYSDTKDNQEELDTIDLSANNLESAIEDLEDARDDINSTETTLIADINEIIEDLDRIKNSTEDAEESIDSLETKIDTTASSLTEISNDLDSIISSLNSQKVVTASNVVSPIKTRIQAIDSESNNKDYMVPIVFSLIILFGSVLLSSTFVLKEKKTKAFFRNFMAPVSNATFLLSTYLTCLAIILLQFSIVLLGGKYVLGMNIAPILPQLLIIGIAAISAFIALGMFIGYLFKSEETIIFSSMIIATLLVFFSNIILPIENTAGNISNILKFSPLVAADLAFKKTMLFSLPVASLIQEIITLAVCFTVFFLASATFRELTKRNI